MMFDPYTPQPEFPVCNQLMKINAKADPEAHRDVFIYVMACNGIKIKNVPVFGRNEFLV
jgi:hypothetical protein